MRMEACYWNCPHNWIVCVLQREETPDTVDTAVAVLTMVMDNTTEEAVHFSPVSTAVVVEDEVVVSDLQQMAEAFALCFGLIYTFHLDYPQKLVHTFTFIQKIVMCLDDNKPLKPCLLTLKNELYK